MWPALIKRDSKTFTCDKFYESQHLGEERCSLAFERRDAVRPKLSFIHLYNFMAPSQSKLAETLVVLIKQEKISMIFVDHTGLYNHRWQRGLVTSHTEELGSKKFPDKKLTIIKREQLFTLCMNQKLLLQNMMPEHNELKKQMNEGMKNPFSTLKQNKIACDSGCLPVN